jgi:hypothetical protein
MMGSKMKEVMVGWTCCADGRDHICTQNPDMETCCKSTHLEDRGEDDRMKLKLFRNKLCGYELGRTSSTLSTMEELGVKRYWIFGFYYQIVCWELTHLGFRTRAVIDTECIQCISS